MQISFSASGTPEQVQTAIHSQARAARIANPGASAEIHALRDAVQKHVAGAGEADHVAVSAKTEIAVTITPATPATEE